MKTIVLNQRKERDELLSRPYLTRRSSQDFDMVDMTSLLKEATYELKKDGSKMMFKDVKKIAKSEKLTRMLEDGFVTDCTKYENDVLYVACGPGVYSILKGLKADGKIKGGIVGVSHPSGANLGRVLCYLGKAEPKDDSYRWCQEKANEAKDIVAATEGRILTS